MALQEPFAAAITEAVVGKNVRTESLVKSTPSDRKICRTTVLKHFFIAID